MHHVSCTTDQTSGWALRMSMVVAHTVGRD